MKQSYPHLICPLEVLRLGAGGLAGVGARQASFVGCVGLSLRGIGLSIMSTSSS